MRYKKQFRDIEEEMQTTIASYQDVIAKLQSGDTKNLDKYKEEIDHMQK